MELNELEKNNICYLAFPDSNSGCMGDTEYCFRIRRSNINQRSYTPADSISSKDCPATLLVGMFIQGGGSESVFRHKYLL